MAISMYICNSHIYILTIYLGTLRLESLYTNKTFVLEEIAFCLHFEDCQKTLCVLAVYLLPSVTENNVIYLFTSV